MIDDDANVRPSVRPAPYLLVITDLQMPRTDGRAVVATPGRCRPGQAVLCMSGSAAECPPVGPRDTAFPFQAKPFTQQALHRAVEHAIGHAALKRPVHVDETREATRDLVAYARALRGR